MVGPFIFFDHMGPAEFKSGDGIDVRPHPHINLATVTYLFHGVIEHRDSLGSDQLIEPGAINWMTAGRGIVHSERTPAKARAMGSRLDGIQCWVALPEDQEEIAPSFTHHPSKSLPEFEMEGVKIKLLLGEMFGRKSPVELLSDLFYLEAKMKKGQELSFKPEDRELAFYVVEGDIQIDEQHLSACSMGVGSPNETYLLKSTSDTHLMILGGKPVGHRFIYWNFVSSSEERMNEAKEDWRRGPGQKESRFAKIPGDDQEFIPLPEEPRNPLGTIM
jgi:redox-sensitive bicupin YhaK (pirin superfamily)